MKKATTKKRRVPRRRHPIAAADPAPAWIAQWMAHARSLLAVIEWGGHDVHYVCPNCGRDRAHGHEAECVLQRLLHTPETDPY